jgi:fructose-specific PTS system IIA-like component
MAVLRFTCDLPTGLHARPASLLAETARHHHAAVAITNETTGASAEARSVLSLIALDIQHGHSVLVEASGDDADDLLKAIKGLVDNHFGESLTPGAPDAAAAPSVRVPVPIQKLAAAIVPGRAVCSGIGQGAAVIVGGLHIPDSIRHARCASPDAEWSRASKALASVRDEIDEDLHKTRDVLRSELLRAHMSIVDDPALRERLEKGIRAGKGAPCAVVDASAHFMASLGASQSMYIRERAADVEDICRRVLGKLDPALLAESTVHLSGPSVVVADSLGVSQLMALDLAHLQGLVLGDVGATSHVVILARSMRVPTIIAVDGPTRAVVAGQRVVVDGFGGFAIAGAPDAAIDYYRREQAFRDRRRTRLEPLLRSLGRTADGVAVEVAANAAMPVEIRAAMGAGADSIGLLRTEMLFLDRAEEPSEQEQYELYRAAVEAASSGGAGGASAEREVIIRTLDIGGDKPAPYITVPEEDNPFLGLRGLRLYHKYPDLLRSQLRAICRASAHGPIKVMAPMVATVGEARWFCDRIAKVQAELTDEGIPHDPQLPVGIMVEVPSVATIIDQLAKVVDFISIGTNDLGQYFLAADRTNKAVAAIHNVREPSFLRLLDQIVSEARDHDLWSGMCGEMAGDPLNLPLLVGLGLTEISAAAPALAPIKSRLVTLDSRACRALLDKAMACETPQEVEALLRQPNAGSVASATPGADKSPVHRDLVIIDCDATTKEQAIQALVGTLHAAGRADDPRTLEDAIWAREATYATGLGFGFAIPHCRSDAVSCPSIAVAKLRTPIDWGSTDNQPVRGVIMLTVRESDADTTHLKLLAKLARRLMHEGFRDSLLGATDANAVVGVLQAELGLSEGA